MSRKNATIKSFILFFLLSFSILMLFFQILSRHFQSQVDHSLNQLSETSKVVSALGNTIRQCQMHINVYCQSFSEQDFYEYENHTQVVIQHLLFLSEQTREDPDCLLFSRVIYQINEAQQDFVKNHIQNQNASSSLFEHVRSLSLIFSEMNEAYAQYLNAYLRLNNTQWFTIQQDLATFKNFQLQIWWLIFILYLCSFLYILSNILEKNKAEKMLLHQTQLSNESRLQMLQMQINPHFLFNTLNLIVHSIQEGTPNTAAQLVKATSELLRQSIEINQTHIPLSKELDLLRTYLIIFQKRFQGRIQLDLDIDNVSPAVSIPPFIIQPLIENAIKHGLNEQISNAHIYVILNDYPEYILLIVEDNGVGVPLNLLEQVLSGKIHSTGIKNIYERLRLLYQYDDVLSINSVSGCGTTVTIKLYKDAYI